MNDQIKTEQQNEVLISPSELNDGLAAQKSMGFMYVAKRPCGRVSAASWDDTGHEKDMAKSIAQWIKRGDKVERIERFENDAQPEWICKSQCHDCKAANV